MTPAFPTIPGQRGLATTRQLLAAGFTESSLRNLVRSGRRPLRSVYSSSPGRLDPETALVAASLWAGGESLLTGLHALERYGLTPPRTPWAARFLVSAKRRARTNPAGIAAVRTHVLPESRVIAGLRTVGAERAIADACRFREITGSEAAGLVLTALQRRLTTPARCADDLVFPGHALPAVRDAVFSFLGGAWSVPEATLADAVRGDPRLPTMLSNPTLVDAAGRRLGTPDGFFPEKGVVVQVHSRQFHDGIDDRGQDRWITTVEKDRPYQVHAIQVVGVTPATLRDDMPTFLDDLVTVLGHRDRWDAEAHGVRLL